MSAPALSPVGEAAKAGDPDRFEAALFEEVDALREQFFTLIALNAELARTRLKVSEPHIGLIRLQWWRDGIQEANEGRPPRAHELAAPTAALLKAAPEGFAGELLRLVDAWERDLDPEPFRSMDALRLQLEATGGRMMRLGGFLALGAPPTGEAAAALEGCGLGDAAARALAATPALAAENRCLLPLAPTAMASLLRGVPDNAAREATQALATLGLTALIRGERAAEALAPENQARLKPILLGAWRARRILTRARRRDCDPLRDLGPESPFRRRVTLLWRGFTRPF